MPTKLPKLAESGDSKVALYLPFTYLMEIAIRCILCDHRICSYSTIEGITLIWVQRTSPWTPKHKFSIENASMIICDMQDDPLSRKCTVMRASSMISWNFDMDFSRSISFLCSHKFENVSLIPETVIAYLAQFDCLSWASHGSWHFARDSAFHHELSAEHDRDRLVHLLVRCYYSHETKQNPEGRKQFCALNCESFT
jgi:hypothetical protein